MKLPRIVITPGEPAGIGPDVLLQAAQSPWDAELIAIADPVVLGVRAHAIKSPVKIIECSLEDAERVPHQPGTLRVYPVQFLDAVVPGKLNLHNTPVVIQSLQMAADACMKHLADAIVTGPIHKGILNDAGIPFTGHTEFLAQAAGVKQTVMLFVVDQLKTALLTTHLPLNKVAEAVTHDKLISVLTILHHDLKKYFGIASPRILITGLNPHAGENGHLGKEEIEIITPALNELRKRGMQLEGPLPADTTFTPDMLKTADAVLGMYHDQVLPVIKHIGFDRAVNMTLGLPFVRTSVDHGTALDLAGSGKTNDGSMRAAIKLAINAAALPSSDG